jgi:hypothetical protein
VHERMMRRVAAEVEWGRQQSIARKIESLDYLCGHRI